MMRRLLSLCLGGVLTGIAGSFLTPAPADDSPTRIRTLVQQLGSSSFHTRKAAGKQLEAIGEQTLKALRAAENASADAEIRRLAENLILEILAQCTKSPTTGMEFTIIDSGQFTMGPAPNESPEQKTDSQHVVRVTQPFILGTYEVTQAEFARVMGHNPSAFAKTGDGKDKVTDMDTAKFPVEMVSWFDAIMFCNELSRRDGYLPYYRVDMVEREDKSVRDARVSVHGGVGYRLPTEAEWEYACRAGTTAKFSFGTSIRKGAANVNAYVSTGGYGARASLFLGRTAEVGSYPANPWGLHEMHGNVEEWCWDWYDADYYGQSELNDPTGPKKSRHRVVRGGSWLLNDMSARSASRFWHTPDERKKNTGFRVARTP